jgi:DNA-binding NtrC family response regulator
LLESELFGHEKGAFTDARNLKRGLIEMAHGGTLLLDEIGAMAIELQAKLLLFLESNEIRRLGGNQPIRVSTQVIAATNENLTARARERTFRIDLLYRLDVAGVEMPPLRAMPTVIPQLAERYTADIATGFHRALPQLTPASFGGLTSYEWPGNARELRNAVERAFIAYDGGPFVVKPPTSMPPVMDARSGVHLPFGLTLDEVEQLYLTETLRRRAPHGELADVADRLGISRKTLWDKRKRYQLES